MKLIRRFSIAAALCAASLCAVAQGTATLTAVDQQTVEFNSMNRQQGFPALYSGRAQYTDHVNGVFTRPKGATGNVPVMVIMHGSAGNRPESTGDWSNYFLSMGVATFVVDSFGPRGIVSTAADQSQMKYAASTVDALVALSTVAALPGVDVSRVGIIGFSRGGLASTNASYEKVRAAVLGQSPLKYALHIALYGGCTQTGTTTGQPILMLMGDKDDYVSEKTCSDFVQVLRNRGANVTFNVFKGVTHGYDVDRRSVYAAQAQTLKDCHPYYTDLDNLSYWFHGTQVSLTEFDDVVGKCRSRGVQVTYDASAKQQSRDRVQSFVRKNFGM